MSNQHINAAINCNKFKGNTRLLLLILANRASDGTSRNGKKNLPFGWTSRSLPQLMDETNIHRKQTITSLIQELVDGGAISRVRRFNTSSKTFVDIDWLRANAYPVRAETDTNVGAESVPNEDDWLGAESVPTVQQKAHPLLGAESVPTLGAVCESLEPKGTKESEPHPTDVEPNQEPKSNEGTKEGMKSSFASLPPTSVGVTTSKTQSRPKRKPFNPLEDWVKPLEQLPTEEELNLTDEPYSLWYEKTKVGFLDYDQEYFPDATDDEKPFGQEYSDRNACIRLTREHGIEEVMDIMRGTWDCPRGTPRRVPGL